MRSKARHIYVGTAWPYVNDLFHIGNVAGALLPADIFSRFHRLLGNDVLSVSGSDFHGTPITLKAEKEGVKPEKLARTYHALTKKYLKHFSISFSLYTSTHTKIHERTVQDMFLRLLSAGYVKKGKTLQLYSESLQRFLQDRYVEGECPHCHFKEARGDQCEGCGRQLESLELLSPISKIDKSPLVPKETENYFLDLKKLQPKIASYLSSRKGWRPWVKKEALGWVKEGLEPRAITRDLSYGVPLPVSRIPREKRIEHVKKKVFYVWFEAVIGYLSAAVEYAEKKGAPSSWRPFFYGKKAETFYMAGQDNLVFHTINWPAQLLAYDEKIALPTNVFVNKFLLLEGRKMSKSRGWYADTRDVAERYHPDSIRFYLTFNMPESKEFNFTWQDFVTTNNSVLVGVIGNLVHRSLSFAKKNFGSTFSLRSSDISKETKQHVERVYKASSSHLEKGEFRNAVRDLVRLCEFGNRLFDAREPWKKVREDKKRAQKEILDFLYIASNLRVLLHPFTPSSSDTLGRYLGTGKLVPRKGTPLWEPAVPEKIRISSSLAPLFPKIDKERVEEELHALHERS